MKWNRITALFLFLFFSFCQVSFSANDASSRSSSSSQQEEGINFQQILDNGQGDNFPGINVVSSKESPFQTVQKYGRSRSGTNPLGTGAKSLSEVDPERYSIQPGDAVTVEMWTPVHSAVSSVVSSMGTLNLNPIGDVPVKGILLGKLSEYLQKTLKAYYKNPHVSANLTDVRQVKVEILGEVQKPGDYELSGVTGALDAIEQAGGLTPKGSLRQIQVKQGNKVVKVLDYFKWRIMGAGDQNPYLEPNEIIYVPALKNQVRVGGEVNRPGSYEILPGETYKDLLEMAGGYTSEAMKSEVKISRITGERAEINLPAADDLALQNGDGAYVPPISLFQQKIKILGEVVGTGVFTQTKSTVTGEVQIERMGWYRLHDKEKVRDVILDMGGVTPQADPGHAWIERKTPEGGKEIIKVDLHKLFADNDQSQNVILQDGDMLVIPPSPNSIYVMGEVNRPGVFPYTPGNGISDYVALAGSGTHNGVMGHVKVVRMTPGSQQPEVFDVNLQAMLSGQKQEKNILLEPGDIIYVPRTTMSAIQDILGFLGNIFLIKQFLP